MGSVEVQARLDGRLSMSYRGRALNSLTRKTSLRDLFPQLAAAIKSECDNGSQRSCSRLKKTKRERGAQ